MLKKDYSFKLHTIWKIFIIIGKGFLKSNNNLSNNKLSPEIQHGERSVKDSFVEGQCETLVNELAMEQSHCYDPPNKLKRVDTCRVIAKQ